jgi:DHA1 family tetracycline resistance protein-like MFS transporter
MSSLKSNRSLAALLWVVFTDSLGSGLAFSVFAALLFNHQSDFLSPSVPDSTRHVIYEALLGIYSFTMFFFAPVIGGLSDRFGRKPVLNLSMAGLTLGFFVNVLGCIYSNFTFLILGRVISGITAGSLSVAQAAVIDFSTPTSKSFYLSLIVLANCLGFSFGPVLGHFFMVSQFLPLGAMTFLVGSVMSLIGLLLIMFFFNETHTMSNKKNKLNLLADFANIKAAFVQPILGKYLLAFLCSMLAYCLFFSNLPIFLHNLSLTNSEVTGYILSSLVISLSLSTMLGGKYVFERFEKAKAVCFIQLVQLVIYGLVASCLRTLELNVLLFVMVSICFGLIYIGFLTIISDNTASDWQGRVMGVVASISSLNWGIASILSGWLDHYSASAALICCVLLMAGAVVTMNRVKSKLNYGVVK